MQEIGANGQVDYIEFNVSDIARSKRFYGEVFGWL
ncbi:glyoxalase/bleomycin resistance/extradiol dioxygenase family protein, partial [Sodalis-like symbiont of Philaenus spumarius]